MNTRLAQHSDQISTLASLVNRRKQSVQVGDDGGDDDSAGSPTDSANNAVNIDGILRDIENLKQRADISEKKSRGGTDLTLSLAALDDRLSALVDRVGVIEASHVAKSDEVASPAAEPARPLPELTQETVLASIEAALKPTQDECRDLRKSLEDCLNTVASEAGAPEKVAQRDGAVADGAVADGAVADVMAKVEKIESSLRSTCKGLEETTALHGEDIRALQVGLKTIRNETRLSAGTSASGGSSNNNNPAQENPDEAQTGTASLERLCIVVDGLRDEMALVQEQLVRKPDASQVRLESLFLSFFFVSIVEGGIPWTMWPFTALDRVQMMAQMRDIATSSMDEHTQPLSASIEQLESESAAHRKAIEKVQSGIQGLGHAGAGTPNISHSDKLDKTPGVTWADLESLSESLNAKASIDLVKSVEATLKDQIESMWSKVNGLLSSLRGAASSGSVESQTTAQAAGGDSAAAADQSAAMDSVDPRAILALNAQVDFLCQELDAHRPSILATGPLVEQMGELRAALREIQASVDANSTALSSMSGAGQVEFDASAGSTRAADQDGGQTADSSQLSRQVDALSAQVSRKVDREEVSKALADRCVSRSEFDIVSKMIDSMMASAAGAATSVGHDGEGQEQEQGGGGGGGGDAHHNRTTAGMSAMIRGLCDQTATVEAAMHDLCQRVGVVERDQQSRRALGFQPAAGDRNVREQKREGDEAGADDMRGGERKAQNPPEDKDGDAQQGWYRCLSCCLSLAKGVFSLPQMMRTMQ